MEQTQTGPGAATLSPDGTVTNRQSEGLARLANRGTPRQREPLVGRPPPNGEKPARGHRPVRRQRFRVDRHLRSVDRTVRPVRGRRPPAGPDRTKLVLADGSGPERARHLQSPRLGRPGVADRGPGCPDDHPDHRRDRWRARRVLRRQDRHAANAIRGRRLRHPPDPARHDLPEPVRARASRTSSSPSAWSAGSRKPGCSARSS